MKKRNLIIILICSSSVTLSFGEEVSLLVRSPFGKVPILKEKKEETVFKEIEDLDQRIEFSGTFKKGEQYLVSLKDLKSGNEKWYEIGDSFGDFKIEAYENEERVLVVSSGEYRDRLAMKQRSELVNASRQPSLPKSHIKLNKPTIRPRNPAPLDKRPPSRIVPLPKNLPKIPSTRVEKA